MRLGALEAGGTKMVCAVGDENGNIICKETIPTTTVEETLPRLLEWFSDKDIEALGIGCFGPLCLNKNSEKYGYITKTPKTGWSQTDMVGAFSGLGIPVVIDTDVNCSALGEKSRGAGRGLDSIVYITIGTGIGIGVITEGKLLHGMLHPEGGHILLPKAYADSFKGCCPFHEGCFEGLASGTSIYKRWGIRAENIEEGHEAWDIEAYYIAQALVNYVMILSPQRIILGGGVMHQKHLLDKVRRYFKELIADYISTDEIDRLDEYIVLQSLSDEQGIMGALILAAGALKNG